MTLRLRIWDSSIERLRYLRELLGLTNDLPGTIRYQLLHRPAGDKLTDPLRRIGKWTVEIIKRFDTAKGFEVLLV